MASLTNDWIDDVSKTHMRNFYNTLSEKDKRFIEVLWARCVVNVIR
jgi:hypothetical protein